jgi:hypothetical protein
MMNFKGWRLAPEGDNRAASTQFTRISFGIGVEVKNRIERRLIILS